MIHSFNVPELRVKQDAVPGISIPEQVAASAASAEDSFFN